MPLYNTKCPACGGVATVFRKIAEMDNLPPCDSCGTPVARVLSAPRVLAGFEPYISPATGKMISSHSQRADDLKRSGSFLYEPGVKEDIARNRIAREERDFAPVAAAVDETVRALVASGKIES